MKKILFSALIFSFSLIAVAQSTGALTTDLNLGAKHNQVLAYLDTYDFTGKTQDDFLDDVMDYSAKLFIPNAFASGKGGIWGEIYFCGSGGWGGDNRNLSYEGVVDELQQQGKIGLASKNFLNNLIAETETLPDYSSFSTKVNTLESNYDISSLPDNERAIIQGALSVFKASALQWNNYYSANEVTPDAQNRFSIRCFFCVLKNDLKGALLGFFIGNCLCTKLGASNPIVCGAIGATVFGALYSWAAKVCPDVCSRCKKPDPGSYPSWICHLPFLYWP